MESNEGVDGILCGQDEWEWHIADPTVLAKVKQLRLTKDERVKYSDVRSVYKCDGLFLKIEHPESPLRQLKNRMFPKAETEFEIAAKLKAAQIPAVECAGWGSCGSRNILVSHEFPGASTVGDYFYRNFVYGNRQYEEFANIFEDFLRLLFRSDFFHDDLHLGNILYSPEMGSIVLVDLIDIEEVEELSIAQKRKMHRVILELREGLSEEDMLLAITGTSIAADTASAREFFLAGVEHEAERRLHEWPKRRRQILDGYHKFIHPLINGDQLVMLCKNHLREEIMAPEQWQDPARRAEFEMHEYTQKEAEVILLRSMFLQLCLVPHRKVAAWELPGKIYFEPEPEIAPAPAGESEMEFFVETLAVQEIITPKENICMAANGRFFLVDIEQVETLID